MKEIPVSRTIREKIAANHNLSQYLDNLHRGRPATPRSWLYEKEDAESVLQRWIPLMRTANKRSPYGRQFDQFDLNQVKKFGPQGSVPPISSKEVQDVLEPLFSPSEFDKQSALSRFLPDALEFSKELFGSQFRRERPKRFESVVDDMRARDTLTTNSGFPRFAKRRVVRSEEIQDALTGSAYEYPAIILFRHYNAKLRPVWMYPMSMNLIEFSFSQPIQEALLNSPLTWVRDYLSPWKGFEDVKHTLTNQWHSRRNICGGDTTAMDAHMRPAQLFLVFTIVSQLFQKKYWKELYRCLMHVNDIPLLVSKSSALQGIHGLASGSGWTQLSETVLQLFMAWMLKTRGQGIGDDFYWIVNMTADQLVSYLGKFGLPANAAKQSVSEVEFSFLQRLFIKGFSSAESDKVVGAYYPTVRALNSMLNPEKFHNPRDWNSDMFCVRNYMILENCVDNPCFEQFVNFVVHGHKDMIPFAKKTDAELDAALAASRLVPGLNPSYNQEKRSKPLYSFRSIAIARRM